MDIEFFDFSLERAKMLYPDLYNDDLILEISFLYDRTVKAGSQVPVMDLAKELDWAPEEVGEVVLTAMDYKYLTNPKRGVVGATITNKALRKLKLFGKHKV
jgi:hypothetical protein|uniref:hypothetical protein n=1 Tax=Candidatus Planktophila sp. TaxID=2175601 RepID=UPI00404B88CE